MDEANIEANIESNIESNIEFEFFFARRPVQWIIIFTIASLMLGTMPARLELLSTTADQSEPWPDAQPRINDRAPKAVNAISTVRHSDAKRDGVKSGDSLASGLGTQQSRWLIEVDLNSANAAELALLPGVGPVLAKRIVLDRVSTGDFKVVDDLQRVRGIGPRKMSEIREMAFVTQ